MGFAQASAVAPVGDGRYEGSIAPGWDIAGNANGGYLLAIAARAMAAEVQRPDPVTVTAHYLAPGRPGPVTADVAVARRGRTFATATATVADAERPVLSVLGTFGDLSARPGGPERVDDGPPPLPPVEDCAPMRPPPGPEDLAGGAPTFASNVDMRLHPDDAGFTRGAPTGTARMRGWFRLPEGEPLDPFSLLVAVDAFPPTVFNADLPVAWTPTVELTAHVRARPVPGWLACAFTTRYVTGGFLEEDGVVWDADGRLVAQSRQLALLPRGPG